MARLFLGACWCRKCGYVAERPRRQHGMEPAARQLPIRMRCPRCDLDLDAVKLQDIRDEETVLYAVAHFMGVKRGDLSEGWLNVTFDAREPTAEFHARSFCPIAFVQLKPNWIKRVPGRNLANLPAIRFSFEHGYHFRDLVFLLDVEQGWYLDDHDAWVVAATWSEGGRSVKKGHLAWADRRRGDHGNGPRVWAVSTTEKLALKRLAERLDMQRRSDDWAVEVDRRQQAELDVVALADLQL